MIRPVFALSFALAPLVLGAWLPACGYHAMYGGGADTARLHVVLVRSVVPNAAASDEVVSGVRDELAREGALAAGSGDAYPRVEIEVLRVDEASEGIAASHANASVGRATAPLARATETGPVARATETGLVARAWIVASRGAEPIRDTGDVRALDVSAAADPGIPGAAASRDALLHEDTLRAVARRVGERLARKILGHPIAADESMGRER